MKKVRNEEAVGLFVIVGFIFMALMIFFVSGVYLFRSGYHLNVMYDYVSILDKGAPVRMAGVRIGEVSAVTLIHEEAAQKVRVRVKLFIEKGVKIRENYLFKIQGTHILSEPHIEITPVSGESSLLEGDRTVEGVKLEPLESLIEKANGIVSSLHAGLGGEENAQNIKDLVANLSKITASMEKVLSGSENDLKKSLENIDSATDSLDKILAKVESGEGTAGQLLMNDELYLEMKAFVKEIKTHPWRLMKKDNGRKFLIF